jgi:transcription termination factor Rho
MADGEPNWRSGRPSDSPRPGASGPIPSELDVVPPPPPAPKPPVTELPRGETINIAKLHAMSIAELNAKAKDLGVENFGTMKKHELVFAILQKNAERRGMLFAEACSR